MTGLEPEADQPMEAAEQLKTTFQNLSHLFGAARPNMDLPAPKKTKMEQKPSQATALKEPRTNGSGEELLHLLARMVLRQEVEIQSIRAQDSYILHMAVDKASLLQILMDQGLQWSQQEQKEAPLRAVLFRRMAAELQTRFTVVEQAPPSSPTWKQLLEAQIILPDGSWPILQWSHEKSQYILAQKKMAVTMKATCRRLGQTPAESLGFTVCSSPRTSDLPWLGNCRSD